MALPANDGAIVHRSTAIQAGKDALAATAERDYGTKDRGVFREAYTRTLTPLLDDIDMAMCAAMDWYNACGDVDDLVDEIADMYMCALPLEELADGEVPSWDAYVSQINCELAERVALLKPGMLAEVCARAREREEAEYDVAQFLPRILGLADVDFSHHPLVQAELVERRRQLAHGRTKLRDQQAAREQAELHRTLAVARQVELAQLCTVAAAMPVEDMLPRLKRLLEQAENESADAKRPRQ